MTDTVADALPIECARVRRVRELYLSIGPAGAPAAELMEDDLHTADRAMSSGDPIAMINALTKLRGWQE